MANEATLVYEFELPIQMTVADGAGIEKGTLLKMSDPMTAAASTTLNDVVAGIAAQEKINGDGRTKLAVYRNGIFKVLGSGNITAGMAVVFTTASNTVEAATINHENILGIALETSTAGQTLLIELKPTVMNLA